MSNRIKSSALAIAAALPLLALVEPPKDSKPAPVPPTASPNVPASAPAPTKDAAREPNPRDKSLLDIAQRYSTFKSATPMPKWAIPMCRAVDPSEYTPAASHSHDEQTHGRRLYKLWVSDLDQYMKACGHTLEKTGWHVEAPPKEGAAVGLTLVKETFDTVDVPKNEDPTTAEHDRTIVEDGDRRVRPGPAAELFIMTKADPKTPDTDNGWIYAVVSADKKTVIRSGRIESCMKCHDTTTRDRLYGPESTWPRDKDGKPTPPVITPAPEAKPSPRSTPRPAF